MLHVVLTRTIYGRPVLAIGQNPRAARLAGVPVERVRALTYVMCGTLAGLAGFLVSAFSGGAALNMGAEYLLSSIAVVVIGGTSVAGGYANVPGIWGAALFLFLLTTMLNTFGLGADLRLILTGLVIIAVIVAASGSAPVAPGRAGRRKRRVDRPPVAAAARGARQRQRELRRLPAAQTRIPTSAG